MMDEMRDIFIRSQDGAPSHPKLLKELRKLFDQEPFDYFFEKFIELLKHALVTMDNHQTVECFFQFITTFTTSLQSSNGLKENEDANDDSDEDESEMNVFVSSLFMFLLKTHNASNNAVRYRVCYLINKILNGLGSGATISEELFEKIGDAMMERFMDKHPLVRTQAVYALSWLQDPMSDNCPVIEAYLYHLSHDPHPNVRHAILSSIATNRKTLMPIMDRIRDVKDAIRKAAYIYLTDKVSVRILTISQRVKILSQGLNDRSASVRKSVEAKLLPVWLKFYENDVEKLLHSLDIQGSSDIGQRVLNILFKSQKPESLIKEFSLLEDNHLIPFEKLTCESGFHWRCLCQYIKSLGGAIAVDGFDDLVPNLIPFCEYIKRYVLDISTDWSIEKKLEHEYISQQLLIIAGEFDLTDQAGRNNLYALVQDILLSTKLNLILVKPLIVCFGKIRPQPDAFVRELAEFISEIREPTTVVQTFHKPEEMRSFELQIAKISVELNVLRDLLESSIETQNFLEAQQIKEKVALLESKRAELQKSMLPSSEEVRVENNDPETLLKCLTISSEMLRQTSVKELSPSVQSLMETLFLPGIQSEDPAVRNEAILSLGLCCMLNVNVASQHLLLFLQISQVDQEVIRVTALKCIFDLLLLFGLEAFQSDETVGEIEPDTVLESPKLSPTSSQESQALSNVMSILSSQLDSEMSEVRTVAAEGIGKLLSVGRIFSPRLYSRLMLLWFSPITKNDTYLRHFLGVFLPSFASSSRGNYETMEEAFTLTMNTLFDAPVSSPLSQIDDWNVASFLIQLTCSHICKQDTLQDSTIHDRLAVKLCSHILRNSRSLSVRVVCKILSHLDLTPHSSLKDLAVLTKDTIKEVKDRQSLKCLERFCHTIDQLLPEVKSSSLGTSVPETDNGLGDITSVVQEETMSEIEPILGSIELSPTIIPETPRNRKSCDLPSSKSFGETSVSSSLVSPSLQSVSSVGPLPQTPSQPISTNGAPLPSVTATGYVLRKRKPVGFTLDQTL